MAQRNGIYGNRTDLKTHWATVFINDIGFEIGISDGEIGRIHDLG
jgi:hypothetical protein